MTDFPMCGRDYTPLRYLDSLQGWYCDDCADIVNDSGDRIVADRDPLFEAKSCCAVQKALLTDGKASR